MRISYEKDNTIILTEDISVIELDKGAGKIRICCGEYDDNILGYTDVIDEGCFANSCKAGFLELLYDYIIQAIENNDNVLKLHYSMSIKKDYNRRLYAEWISRR